MGVNVRVPDTAQSFIKTSEPCRTDLASSCFQKKLSLFGNQVFLTSVLIDCESIQSILRLGSERSSVSTAVLKELCIPEIRESALLSVSASVF